MAVVESDIVDVGCGIFYQRRHGLAVLTDRAGNQLIGDVEVESVQKEKMDVPELVAGETGGIAFKLPKRLTIELDDRVKFYTREVKKKTL